MNLKTKTGIVIFVLSSPFLASIAMAASKGNINPIYDKSISNSTQISYESIKAAGENFIEFLRKAGQSEAPVSQNELQIFASQCKKIVNGKVLFTSPHVYPEQIANARKAIGKWTVSILWETASKENRTYTVLFKWSAEKMPESITMATLFLDEAGKIIEIQEVYNLYDEKKLSIQDT